MDDGFEFLLVVGDAAAGAAEGEGGADDEGHGANVGCDCFCFLHRVGHTGDGEIEADLDHGVFETLAVFAFVDGVGIGADHADAVFIESAGLEELDGNVEGGLAAEGRKKSIGPLLDNDFFDGFGRDGLDVGPLRELRVGHDGSRVGIDQDNLVSFFAEGLAGLGTGIVKFASLSDDNRACSDDENFFDAGILGHVFRAVWLKLRVSAKGGRFCKAPSL